MTTRPTKRTVTYARVSTRDQATEGHSLEAQRDRTAAYCAAMGLDHVEHVVDAGVSGGVAPADRPGLGRAIADLDEGRADILVTVSLSRLGRRQDEVTALARRARETGWGLVVMDVGMDTTTPTGKAMLGMLAVMAELERDQCSERTRAGLAKARSKGVRLGRPVSDRTLRAAARATELRAAGRTWQQVADTLTAESFPTARGCPTWSAPQALRAVRSATMTAAAVARRNGA